MSQNFLARHAARIFGRPLLIAPGPLESFLKVLGSRLGLPDGVQFVRPEVAGAKLESYQATEAKPIDSKSYGVAVIRVMGPLVQHAGQIEANCTELTSYEAIGAQVRAAIADPKVQGILLHVDSPGGEVAGAFDLAAAISTASKTKPIVAFAEDLALSAGYLLASAANEIVATQTGYVGSIGVVSTHVDLSGALAKEGIVVTHLHAGARKVDGSPYFSLSAEARAEIEGFIARDYGLFVAHVEAHRPMTLGEVRGTEAAVFTAQDGVANGLADEIGTRETALQRLAALIGDREASSHKQGSSAVSEAPAVVAAANHKQEDPMDPKNQQGGGEVIDFAAENARLKAENAKLVAMAEVTKVSVKLAVIDKFMTGENKGGKVTVVPGNLEAIKKVAEHMEAAELEAYLGDLPAQTHAKASGIADSKPKAEDSLRKIAGQLGMTPAQVEAFSSVKSVHLDGTVTLANGDRVLASSINVGRA